ncbi:MAG: hypothetical protein ACON35_04835 [Candidatus Marinamargulisbacteria bacterium]
MISFFECHSLKKTISIQSTFPENQILASVKHCLEELKKDVINQVYIEFQSTQIKLAKENVHCFGLAFFWILGLVNPDVCSPQKYDEGIKAMTKNHQDNYKITNGISDNLAESYGVKQTVLKPMFNEGNNMAVDLAKWFMTYTRALIMYWPNNDGHTFGILKMTNDNGSFNFKVYNPRNGEVADIASAQGVVDHINDVVNDVVPADKYEHVYQLAFYPPLPPPGDQQIPQKRSIHVDPRSDEDPRPDDKSPKKKFRTDSTRNAPSPG